MLFKKLLSEYNIIIKGIVRSYIEINTTWLIILNIAYIINETSAKIALKEITKIKVLILAMALTIINCAV
jgi:hypothetical protein